jgi:uncharacterized membrane protein
MTPEERKLLEETHEMVLENTKVLNGLQRANRFSLAFRFVYWTIIIGSSIGAYYLIQPYIETLKDAYSSLGVF